MLQSWEIPGDDAGSVGVFCRQGHCDLFNYKPQSPAEILEWEVIFELVGRWLSISEHLLLLPENLGSIVSTHMLIHNYL